jgi:hypothetical protein
MNGVSQPFLDICESYVSELAAYAALKSYALESSHSNTLAQSFDSFSRFK